MSIKNQSNYQGWVSIHRELLDNPIAKKSQYLSLWLCILLLANHRRKQLIWNGEKRTIKRGQFITGRKKLSKLTGIPESTIEKILRYLESEKQIEQIKTNQFRVIKVINYNYYQKNNSSKNNSVSTK